MSRCRRHDLSRASGLRPYYPNLQTACRIATHVQPANMSTWAIFGPAIFEVPNEKRTRTATRSARADASGKAANRATTHRLMPPPGPVSICLAAALSTIGILHNTICGSRTIGCREHHGVRRGIPRMSTCMIVHVFKSRHTGRQKRSSSSAVLQCRHVDM